MTHPRCTERPRDAQFSDLVDGDGSVRAEVYLGNPLANDDLFWLESGRSDVPMICWSGTLGDDLFSPHPHNWMSAGFERFEAFRTAAAGRMEAIGRRLLIRPHARHVISDVHLAAKLVHVSPHPNIGVAPDLAALLEPTMMDEIEDHLGRAVDILGPAAEFCWCADVEVSESHGDPCMQRKPWRSGCLPHDLVERMLAERLPASAVLIMDESSTAVAEAVH